MRRVLVLVAVAALAAVAASTAAATNECRGLMVCVPVAGPWVVAAPAQVEFQMSCPPRYVVAGLDAELSTRGIDIGFVGAMGSPVNPGITTARDVVFLGRLVRQERAATFRPHIGCVPAAGGGRRTPTAYHAFPPGKPSVRHATLFAIRGTTVRTVRCDRRERLVRATHAVAFDAATPPGPETVALVHAAQRVRNGEVTLTARAPAGAHALVQVDLVCAPR